MADQIITGSELQYICPRLVTQLANSLADKICFVTPAYKMDDPRILEEFIAQIAHESGEFRIKSESLFYKTPEQLMKIWPSHFHSIEFAKQYCHDEKKLGNYIYGSTSIAKSLGNIKPEDGYNFRGSGFIQLTGRASMERYQKYVGIDTIENTALLLRTQDYWALDSACWEFSVDKKLSQLAIEDDFKTITKRTNGGLIGYSSRLDYYKRSKEVFSKK